jgi:hypothetical protein
MSKKAHEFHTGTGISWTGKLSHHTYEVEGEKRATYEVVVAGPGAKLEVLDAKQAAGARPSQAATAHQPGI